MEKFRAAGLAVLVLLFPAGAWAKCRTDIATGWYQLYAMTYSLSGTFSTVCSMKINADSTIKSGTRCIQRDVLGSRAEIAVGGGKIQIRDTCKITGNITISGFNSVVDNGFMSRDGNVIEGVGVNPSDGSIFRFTAIRRL